MKAEIIAVGTELLLGQIVNTNAQFISRKLAEEGISVFFHTVVGDNPGRLTKVIEEARKRADLLIFTGGLGPTKDDLTKEVVAQIVGVNMAVDTAALEKITAFYKQRKIPMTPNNVRQAHVLEGAHIFPNDHGLAPGMGIKHGEHIFVLLPGPPLEMIPMFNLHVLPFLRSHNGESSIISSRVLRFFGIGESALEAELLDLIDHQVDPTIAPYAKETEVSLRITTKAQTLAEGNQKMAPVVAEIYRRLGQYIYNEGEETSIESTLLERCFEKRVTIACAESCTGGLVSQLLTSLQGASAIFKGGVVCYSNWAKEHLLHIPTHVLSEAGAVSSEVAELLAEEVRTSLNTDYGVSITGVAGPDPVENKPVGLVYIGISSSVGTYVKTYHFAGSRNAIQLRAAKSALFEVWKNVKER